MSEPQGEVQSVDVVDGFYPLLTPPFLDAYGPDSAFAIAVADLYTGRLARMLEKAGHLGPGDPVGYRGPREPEGSLQLLLLSLGEERQRELSGILYHEAFREGALGGFGELLDASLGAGTFRTWLAALENDDLELANTLATRDAAPG